MTDPDKLNRMQEHLRALGVSPYTAAPPLWRLLWRLGIDLPPPLFMGIWPVALLMGSFFGVLWGILMWLFMWLRQGMPLWIMLSSAVLAGLLFGLFMAVYFRHLARKHRLHSWSAYMSPQP